MSTVPGRRLPERDVSTSFDCNPAGVVASHVLDSDLCSDPEPSPSLSQLWPSGLLLLPLPQQPTSAPALFINRHVAVVEVDLRLVDRLDLDPSQTQSPASYVFR